MLTTLFLYLELGNGVIALCLLCYLVPDSRSKPDHGKIIIFCEVSSMKMYFQTSSL